MVWPLSFSSLHAAEDTIWFWTEGEELILSCMWEDIEEGVGAHRFAGGQEVEWVPIRRPQSSL